MLNAFVIVWRESLEAMLVIGILAAWVGRSAPSARRALWLGVAGGVGLALLLAALMQGAIAGLDEQFQEVLQVGLILLAAGLMTQMVLWMQRHARGLRGEIEAAMDDASRRRGQLGIAAVAGLAVAREGAETVIFLQGVAGGQGAARLLAAAALGVGLAALAAGIAARGLRRLSLRTVFRVSAALLLAFAAGFVATATDRLVGLEYLPAGMDPLWDTSAWMDDGTGPGKWLADGFGYRARPAATVVAAYAGYWGVLLLLRRLRGSVRAAHAT